MMKTHHGQRLQQKIKLLIENKVTSILRKTYNTKIICQGSINIYLIVKEKRT